MSKYDFCVGVGGMDITALLNKMGGVEGAKRFLRGELELKELVRPWTVNDDGTIGFTVTSDGTPGEDWIARLEGKGFRLSKYAKSVLRSRDFKPTTGVTTRVVVIPGSFWKSDSDRLTKNIRAEAASRNWVPPNAEAACLIREKFTDEELAAMGLCWIVVMHEPIKDSGGDPSLLSSDRSGEGRWFYADCGGPGGCWDVRGGFAFGQVSSQSS